MMSAEKFSVPEDEVERRRAQRLKNQPLIDMVDEWLASDSNEDEAVWQRLKPVLEESHTPRRKLFHDE